MTPNELLQTIKPALQLAPRSSTLQIIQSLRCDGGKVIGSDISSQIEIECAEAGDWGVCVPAARLSAALGALPDGQLASKVGDGRLTLTVGRSRQTIPTLPVQDFPMIALQCEIEWSPAGEIQQHIADVSVAAANQDVRYYLNAVHIDRKPSRTIVEASDGHRVSQATSDGGPALEVLVPRDAFKSIAACNWTEIGMARDKLALRGPGAVLIMSSVDGKFPDIGRVMPGFDKPVIFTANKSDILAALASGGAAARDSKYGGVKMTVGAIGGDVVFSSSSADGSESTAACNVEGATQFTSGLNSGYLADAINFVRGDTVTFRCESEQSAMLITGDDEEKRKAVVMPMRL